MLSRYCIQKERNLFALSQVNDDNHLIFHELIIIISSIGWIRMDHVLIISPSCSPKAQWNKNLIIISFHFMNSSKYIKSYNHLSGRRKKLLQRSRKLHGNYCDYMNKVIGKKFTISSLRLLSAIILQDSDYNYDY